MGVHHRLLGILLRYQDKRSSTYDMNYGCTLAMFRRLTFAEIITVISKTKMVEVRSAPRNKKVCPHTVAISRDSTCIRCKSHPHATIEVY